MSAPGRAPRAATFRACLPQCFVWVLSAAPFFVAEERLAGVSRAALAALPWIAWSALPRKVDAGREPGVASWLAIPLELVLLLPPLALGAWIDLAAGATPSQVGQVSITSVVLVTLLAAGARIAATNEVALRRHAIAWIVLVAGVPLLHEALVLGGAPLFGSAPSWMEWLARASPVAWGIESLRPSDAPVHMAWGPLLVALLLLAIGASGARRQDEAGSGAQVRA